MKKYGRRILKIVTVLCAAAALPGVLQVLLFLGCAAFGRWGTKLGSAAIIGGADGPTAIFIAARVAPVPGVVFQAVMTLLAAAGCAALWLTRKRK